MREVYITTVDNPYDPRDEFEKWRQFDESKGYNTCGYLARIARTSDGLSDIDNSLAIEAAIDEIIDISGSDFYKKIVY